MNLWPMGVGSMITMPSKSRSGQVCMVLYLPRVRLTFRKVFVVLAKIPIFVVLEIWLVQSLILNSSVIKEHKRLFKRYINGMH